MLLIARFQVTYLETRVEDDPAREVLRQGKIPPPSNSLGFTPERGMNLETELSSCEASPNRTEDYSRAGLCGVVLIC